jgi:hypothetical protein
VRPRHVTSDERSGAAHTLCYIGKTARTEPSEGAR